MTLQEIFDKCTRHLLTQMAKSESINDKGVKYCAYRGEEGRKCAAGIFIADEHYSKALEGSIAHSERVMPALVNSGYSDKYAHWELLGSLQSTHDGYPTSEWKNRLLVVAEIFMLNDQVLEEFP